jgi:antibiotic biosynthesis monooxygenase (ABM) superfamily enzyme
MKVRPDVPEEYLQGQMRALSTERMKGWMTTSFFRSDADPNEWWMVAMFDTKESYRANAETPAQHAMYMMLRACLEEDPEWHDVDEVMKLGH